MTPEHRLAIQIMDECGKTPHEIVEDRDWLEPPKLKDVLNVLFLDSARRFGKRCNNIFIEADGLSLTIAQWSRRTGIDYDTLHSRHKRGWSPEQIVKTPPRKKEAA